MTLQKDTGTGLGIMLPSTLLSHVTLGKLNTSKPIFLNHYLNIFYIQNIIFFWYTDYNKLSENILIVSIQQMYSLIII